MSPTLFTRLGPISLPNPLVLASGVLGVSASSMGFCVANGVGAVTAKSCSLQPRKGHAPPVVAVWEQGMLNAVGLSNPGAHVLVHELREYKERFPDHPLIASVFGGSPEEFAAVTEILAEAGPDLIEVNVSCPNVQSEFGVPFSADFDATATITRAVKDVAGDIPVSTKLSVNCPSLYRMAQVVRDAGADMITAINTIGPGMLIDVDARAPVLTNKVGGVSGPAIFPVALKAVWEVRKAVDLPIIGTGGVSNADQALQMIMAGADAVGVGTSVWSVGATVFSQINEGMLAWMEENGVSSLDEIRGVIHG